MEKSQVGYLLKFGWGCVKLSTPLPNWGSLVLFILKMVLAVRTLLWGEGETLFTPYAIEAYKFTATANLKFYLSIPADFITPACPSRFNFISLPRDLIYFIFLPSAIYSFNSWGWGSLGGILPSFFNKLKELSNSKKGVQPAIPKVHFSEGSIFRRFNIHIY